MIKNERQYRITKSQAESFARALASHDQMASERFDPQMIRAEREALESQLEDLRAQIAEYEALRSGERPVLEVESLGDLPRALIEARIAAGLSQRDLAERIGVKEQQIQRYEASEYATASLARITKVTEALGLKIREQLYVPVEQVSLRPLLRRLEALGVDKRLLFGRLLPRSLASELQEALNANQPDPTGTLKAATMVERIFRWSPGALFGREPPVVDLAVAGLARFKVPVNAEERRLTAYTFYAHHLALMVLEGTRHLEAKVVPRRASTVHDQIRSRYGSLTFEAVLRYVWDLGIPVVPLSDRGAFHGACWRVAGRNVIVLKQTTTSTARWAFDLLHEMCHAAADPSADHFSIVESEIVDPTPRDREEEAAASQFAGNVLLGGMAEDLAARCVDAAGGAVEQLKSVVPRIASEAKVDIGALANYMAFRLSLQDINWWGAAANLQPGEGPQPWDVARDVLLDHLNLGSLNDVDRELVVAALSE